MSHHQRIDQWSLAMAREIVSRIESDPSRAGLASACETALRWHRQSPNASTAEWLRILEQPWEQVRAYSRALGSRLQFLKRRRDRKESQRARRD